MMGGGRNLVSPGHSGPLFMAKGGIIVKMTSWNCENLRPNSVIELERISDGTHRKSYQKVISLDLQVNKRVIWMICQLLKD